MVISNLAKSHSSCMTCIERRQALEPAAGTSQLALPSFSPPLRVSCLTGSSEGSRELQICCLELLHVRALLHSENDSCYLTQRHSGALLRNTTELYRMICCTPCDIVDVGCN
eukprot:470177-Amphidinium_carterae.1